MHSLFIFDGSLFTIQEYETTRNGLPTHDWRFLESYFFNMLRKFYGSYYTLTKNALYLTMFEELSADFTQTRKLRVLAFQFG